MSLARDPSYSGSRPEYLAGQAGGAGFGHAGHAGGIVNSVACNGNAIGQHRPPVHAVRTDSWCARARSALSLAIAW